MTVDGGRGSEGERGATSRSHRELDSSLFVEKTTP